MTTSLAALGRAAQAEELYAEARAFSTNPGVHQQAAYAMAMLYTRHHDPARRDNRQAMAWINEAIAIASVLPDATERTFQSVFSDNGRALIRVHQGDLPGALALVDACLARADTELSQHQHRLHRSVLLYNRAQVLVGLGRDSDAMADYEAALRLSPPFPEVYYNRADMRLAAGDIDAGLSGLDYVLELDPGYVDAYVNRAGVRAGLGDLDGPGAMPRSAWSWTRITRTCTAFWASCTRRRAGTTTPGKRPSGLAADPALQAAWAGLAALAHQAGDPAAAVADLNRALDLGDDAALRYNRAVAYQALGAARLRRGEVILGVDHLAGRRRVGRRRPPGPQIILILKGADGRSRP